MNAGGRQAEQEPLESTRKLFIDRKGIGFFKAIFESYEDIAIFSVLDGKNGLIELIYPNCFEKDVLAIVDDMIHYGFVIREAPADE